MRVSPAAWITLLLLAAALPMVARGAQVNAPVADEAKVTLPKGSTLDDALRRVSRAAGLPVICQAPQFQRTLIADVKAQPLPAALNEVSRSYHLHWVRTPSAIVLVRLLWDDRETLDLELEEIQAMAADALRLVRPLVPVSPWDLSASAARRDFYRSLTPRQISLMQREGGLPFRGLSEAQQADLIRLSAQSIYDDLLMHAEKSVEAYAGWSRCRLAYQQHEIRGALKRLLWFEYPWSREEDGVGSTQVRDDYPEAAPATVQAQPSGEVISGQAPRLPAAFRRPVPVSDGPTQLGPLAASIGAAVETQVRVPAWAKNRDLLVFGSGASAASLLEGLAVLYGWEVRQERRGEWLLWRAPVRPPRDYASVDAAIRGIIPPVARLTRSRTSQQAYELRQIHAAITRERGGRQWEAVRVGELTPGLQRALANHVLGTLFYEVVWEARKEPRKWFLQPQLGFLRLRGEVGPGKQPELYFLLRERIPPNNSYRETGWGWLVNSSSLGE
jgi:hypothetical protein